MVKGMCLEPAMLCRPPLASPRRGWMELPDVGDFCQVVIQKWMNHILTEIPLHLLYVWYDIQSFDYVFLYMLWIRMIWMQHQIRRLSFCLVSVIYMLRNVPYAIDMLGNISYAIDMLQLLCAPFAMNWYVLKCPICHWYAPITLCSICYESNMFWMIWYLWFCI